jgi:hypothetical protein
VGHDSLEATEDHVGVIERSFLNIPDNTDTYLHISPQYPCQYLRTLSIIIDPVSGHIVFYLQIIQHRQIVVLIDQTHVFNDIVVACSYSRPDIYAVRIQTSIIG